MIQSKPDSTHFVFRSEMPTRTLKLAYWVYVKIGRLKSPKPGWVVPSLVDVLSGVYGINPNATDLLFGLEMLNLNPELAFSSWVFKRGWELPPLIANCTGASTWDIPIQVSNHKRGGWASQSKDQAPKLKVPSKRKFPNLKEGFKMGYISLDHCCLFGSVNKFCRFN